jgi:hypothetical protein
MTGNIYGRRMFRMANGGMMPPVDPAMMGGGAPMPPGTEGLLPPEMAAAAADLPPEVLRAANQEMASVTDDMLMQEVQRGVGDEINRSIGNLDSASDYRDVMNSVWDDDADIDSYRSKLAEVVGREDADRTPDSVLALVQPTLQLAQIDQGVGALMQEELAEISGMSGNAGGIAELAIKSAVADGMAAETGALVNTVGNMPNGGGSVGNMMMAAVGGGMAPGPVPMAPEMV